MSKMLLSLFWFVNSDSHCQEEQAHGHNVGVDLISGDTLDPAAEGIWDNYRVHRQMLNSW